MEIKFLIIYAFIMTAYLAAMENDTNILLNEVKTTNSVPEIHEVGDSDSDSDDSFDVYKAGSASVYAPLLLLRSYDDIQQEYLLLKSQGKRDDCCIIS